MRRRTLALGAVVLAGGALVLFCCTGSGRRPAEVPAASSSAEAAPPAPTATDDPTPPVGTATATASSAPLAPTTAPAPSTTAAAPAGGPGTRIADAVRGSDPRDLQLLAGIERELHRDPPPEVHAVLALRQRGASRAELTRAIQALGDLQVRALAFRWLDYVMPASDAGVP